MAVAALAAAGVQQASATENGVQAQIDSVLKASPGGKQISANQIAWRNGKVVLTIPRAGEQAARGANEPSTTAGSPNCPYTWTCVYQDASWNGRRLQFSDCGYYQDFADYGFNDKASSWDNNQTPNTQSWVYNWVGYWSLLWTEGGARSYSSYVGAANNDKADAIWAC